MKHPIALLIPFIAIGLFWLSIQPVPKTPALINAEFEAFFIESLIRPKSEVWTRTTPTGVQPILLDKKDLDRIAKGKNPIPKTPLVDQFSILENFQYDKLNPCNKFRSLNLKSKLTDQIFVLEKNQMKSKDGSSELKNDELKLIQKHRYLNKVRGYSGAEMSIDELIEYGESKVDQVTNDLLKLEHEIVDDGLATSLDEFQSRHVKSLSTEEEIIKAFDARRSIIGENLSKLFLEYDLPDTNVKASRKLSFVYAIGTYSPRRSTFHFYWDGQSFLEKDIDYLMIHELVPGHHMQYKLARSATPCAAQKGMPPVPYSRYSRSFTEGWATYIEQFGPDLGLFQTFEQRLGYWDWQLIRGHRIILDARLHHDDWTWEQFESYWIDHLPERLQNLAEREYKRLRKMPLQTLTYKFGADAFMKLRKKEEARLGSEFDIRTFHDKVLRMPPVPMDILEESFAVMP